MARDYGDEIFPTNAPGALFNFFLVPRQCNIGTSLGTKVKFGLNNKEEEREETSKN